MLAGRPISRVAVLRDHLLPSCTAGDDKSEVVQGDKDHLGFGSFAQKQGAIDEDAIAEQYEAFRKARSETANQKGHLGQYTHLEGQFSDYLKDPYSPTIEPREALTDSVEVIIVGGGFSALLTTARLRDAGITDTRIFEKGGDVGGTWYW